MDPAIQYIVAVAATITATAAIGTFATAVATYRAVRQHERVLFGEEDVEAWDGLTTVVKRHDRVLREEDLL